MNDLVASALDCQVGRDVSMSSFMVPSALAPMSSRNARLFLSQRRFCAVSHASPFFDAVALPLSSTYASGVRLTVALTASW